MKCIPGAFRFPSSTAAPKDRTRSRLALLLTGAFALLPPLQTFAHPSGEGSNSGYDALQPENIFGMAEILSDATQNVDLTPSFPKLPSLPHLGSKPPVASPASSHLTPAAPSTSTFHRVLAFHEKAIAGVHTAVWNALPKPWTLFSGPKADAARPSAKTAAR